MSSYQNKSKAELWAAIEKLQQLNDSLISTSNKEEKKYDDEEQRIHEKDLLFRKLSANVPDLIYQFTRKTDGSYCFPMASAGIKNIFGCSPEDVLDDFSPVAKVIYPEDADRVTRDIEYSAKHLTFLTCEFRVQLPGKEIQWILSKSTPEKLPDGSVTWYGFNANITSQKKAEEMLKIEKRRLSDILKGTNIGTWEWNIQTGETIFNERWAEIIGYSLSEISPINIETWMKFAHPDDLTTSGELLDKHFKGELDYYECEGRMKHKNGHWIWVLDKGKVHSWDKNGNPLLMSGTHQDITERKKIDAELKTSEDRYQALLTNLNVGVVVHAPDTSIVMNNSKASELLGLSDDQLKGKKAIGPNWKFLYENFFPIPIEEYPVHKIKSTKKELKDFILGINRPNKNDVIWVSVNGFPVFDNMGQLSEIVISFVDITKRKESEQSLVSSKTYLNKIINTVASPIFVKDDKHRFCLVNDSLCSFLNLQREDLLGKTGNEHFSKEQNEMFFAKDNEVLKSGKENVNEEFITNGKGELRTIITRKTLYTDAEGNKFLVGVINDITESKKAEEKLKETSDYLNSLFDYANAPIITWDTNFKITRFNHAFESLTGLLASEVLEKELQILFPKESTEESLKKITQTATGEFLKSVEIPIQHKNGEFRIVLWNSANVYDKDGKTIVSTIAQGQDITERKQTEAQVQKLSQAVEQSPVSIIITDTFGNVEYVNPKALEITGYELTELLGKNPKIFSSGEKPESEYKNLWETILSGKEWRGEFHNKKKSGELYWELSSISPIINDKGEITNFLAVKEDITENKQTLEDLIIAKEHAEESDKLKSAFLANMSHEIRTPMNGILGFAELLKDPDISGEKQQKYIYIIEKSGERMLNIINDIVDISKIESGTMKVYVNETDINEKIENLYQFFKPEAEAKKIQLSVKKALPENESVIKTDSEKVYAILSNLLKNAIKFTNEGNIEFGVDFSHDSTGETQLKFFVKDTGIGIPKDRQKAIFERFIQADIYDKMALQGAGLGLSISKAYVEMLGGKIWVESEEEIGSAFYFTIPCNRESGKIIVQDDENVTKADQKTGNLKILIAEDDESSEMFLSMIVKEYASEIYIAKNGFEAVEICRNHPAIDLILMDIQMPEMSGYEATRQIREFNNEVVIIAQTAFALSQDRQIAIDAGCNDYISKPIKIHDLIALVKKYAS